MQLMTKALESRFAQLGEQDKPDAVVVAHYFSPYTGWDWYATEYDPETNICFGLVKGFETELGSFSLDELGEVKIFGGLLPAVERDLYWNEITLDQLK